MSEYYSYITKDKDRWDLIAYKFYKNPTKYEPIIQANPKVPITPILESGIKETKETFCICECDPERTNPICENCFNICHKGGNEYPHKLIKSSLMNAVCICGYRCHRLFTENSQQDKQYKKSCTFGELAGISDLNFGYQSLD